MIWFLYILKLIESALHQVSISCKYEYRRLKETCDSETRNNLVLSDSYSQQVIV